MEILLLVATGALIGLIVGLTGVGGGALMTPALLMFGFPPHIAIGTDLWFAALTKSGGMVAHQKRGHIKWPVVISLASGSLPAAIITGIILAAYFDDPQAYAPILTTALGIMLIATSAVLLFKKKITKVFTTQSTSALNPHRFSWLLCLSGMILGVLVTLSSVGAGAIGTAILMILFPTMLAKHVVGSDIAHAVPLTFVAGLVHLFLGNVDFTLLAVLLCGSLPAIYVGTYFSGKIPSHVLQPILASLLMVIGVKYALF